MTAPAIGDPLQILRRIRDAPPRPRPGERCEMCNLEIDDSHQHVVNIERRGLMCTCRGCWLLFTVDGAGGGRYRAVPNDYRRLEDFDLPAGTWDALGIPVNVVFFFANSSLGRVVAFYPSPAGATESLLDLQAWDDLVAANPVLAALVPDVQALLLRVGERSDALVVPIDACYELVGEVRRVWKGFDGGPEVHDALECLFASIGDRCR